MARITYAVTASEPWEAAAALAAVLDFTTYPVTIHDDRVTIQADENDTEIIAKIRQAIAA